MAVPTIKSKCPKCGAMLTVNKSTDHSICVWCGTNVPNELIKDVTTLPEAVDVLVEPPRTGKEIFYESNTSERTVDEMTITEKLSVTMKPLKFGIDMFIVAGAFIMLLLQMNFALFWKSYYSHFPFKGYLDPIVGPPFFSASTETLYVTLIVLFILPLVVLWFARASSFVSTLGLLSGVMLANIAIWLSSKQLREDSNMWPIDLVLLTIMTAAPLFLGCITQIVIRKVLSYLQKQL